MLKHLHISNFAIVPTLELDFQPGFTAITGETGAGKSILVDALGLLLGERSDANWVRPGEDRAELAAEFGIEDNAAVNAWLEAFELVAHGQCLLRRTINSLGRSRAFINGSPVTVAQLQDLGNLLVEIHGQNEHLRLTKTAALFDFLDESGDYKDALLGVEIAYKDWKKSQDELQNLKRESYLPVTDLEFMQFQLDELRQHDLGADSVAALQTEYDRLAAGGALLDAVSDSMERLDPESNPEAIGINTGLNQIFDQLQAFAHLDKDIAASCQMLQEAGVNTAEAVNALRAARERIELDPERFAAVADSLSRLNELARKHGVPMQALSQIRDSLVVRIETAGNTQQHHDEIKTRLAHYLKTYRDKAAILHNERSDHAGKLAQSVTELMSKLGMTGGCFELNLSFDPQRPPSLRGDDHLQASVSANAGLPTGPLAKIASGGELSRLSLAIKVASGGRRESLTQIFDEIDVGIGGDTANTVGRQLQRLAGHGQALCVTHLAQVAVCATHQLRVHKVASQSTTRIDTHLLDSVERVDEIARMLSGHISKQSRAHAEELLRAAHHSR